MKGILIPQTIFVGDTAQFLFPLSEQDVYRLTHNGITQNVPIPLHAKIENEAMSVKEIRFIVKDTRPYLMITFIPWETGTIYFPSFSFLQLQRELPAVTVASLIDSTTALALEPPKRPPLIPGTDYTLYTSAALIFVTAALFATSFFFIYRMIKKRNTHYHAKKRMRLLKKAIKKLHKRLQKDKKKAGLLENTTNHTEAALWYTEIDHILRLYFFSFFKDSSFFIPLPEDQIKQLFFSYTYEEIIDKITIIFSAYPNVVQAFTIIYTILEKNRFCRSINETFEIHSKRIESLMKKIIPLAEKIETLTHASSMQRKGEAHV